MANMHLSELLDMESMSVIQDGFSRMTGMARIYLCLAAAHCLLGSHTITVLTTCSSGRRTSRKFEAESRKV